MGKVVKKVIGGDEPKAAPMPIIKEPTVMPVADDEQVKKAKQQEIARQQARGGRASTMLSSDDRLGG